MRILPILALILLLPTIGLAESGVPLAPDAQPSSLRVQITLDPRRLPEPDRTLSADRIQAIEEALSSGLPLFRSFDPREVLARSLAVLAQQGADLSSGSATLSFDTLEVTIPAESVDVI